MTVAELFQILSCKAAGKKVRVSLDDGAYELDGVFSDDADEVVLCVGSRAYDYSETDDEDK